MSKGFASGTTKSLGEFERMVESRFSDSPPGADVSKNSEPFESDEKKQSAWNDLHFKKEMAAAGIVSDQEMLDQIDEDNNDPELPKDHMEPVDEKYWKNEKGLKMSKIDGPEAFHKEMEKRMAKMNEGEDELKKLEDMLASFKKQDPEDISGKQAQVLSKIDAIKGKLP